MKESLDAVSLVHVFPDPAADNDRVFESVGAKRMVTPNGVPWAVGRKWGLKGDLAAGREPIPESDVLAAALTAPNAESG